MFGSELPGDPLVLDQRNGYSSRLTVQLHADSKREKKKSSEQSHMGVYHP
jgi:hypothetical protein